MSLGKKLVVLFITFILALAPLNGVLAEDFTAQTMRLLHYEGEVEILDASGKSRFVMENARFKSGESMRTGENSVASISLDATKIVTMDQLSVVEFVKQGSHLQLTIKEGTLLLDVQEKLDENESLDVQTSTMTVGIRGTVIAVTVTEIDGVRICKITVLEGVTRLSYTDENGNEQSAELSAGHTAVFTDLDDDGLVDFLPEIRETEQADTEGFVDGQIQQDPQLLVRIEQAQGQGNSGNEGNQSVGSPVAAPTTE
ncbi:MAG: FecR domain-containing protein [Clostridia bacterium]|nr:FecR domain-containing protein [Clostridia bacterium]